MTNTEIVDEAMAKRAATYTNAMIRFGERNQMIVAVEELSECQKEICKVLRGGEDFRHLAEEIADVIDREKLASRTPKLVDAYVSYWYGMTRSLVSAQWFLWEEDSPEGKLRLKIAKKIDKFC